LAVDAQRDVLGARGGRVGSRLVWQAIAAAVAVLLALAALLGALYAGSPARIAEGVRIAGIDVGGLTAGQARALLERRSAALAGVPVTFVAGEDRWRITPRRLGVEADWAAAVQAAQQQGRGLGPFRGLRRAKVRVFGADIVPPVKVYEPALQYQLTELEGEIDRPVREAAVVFSDLKPILVEGQAGRELDRDRAARTVVSALASLSRTPTALPVEATPPTVTADELEPAVEQARLAVSGPLRLEHGKTWWRLKPSRIAELLALPRDGSTKVEIGGPGADAWFARFGKNVSRPPADASFRLVGSEVALVPHRDGVVLDVDATRASMLRGVLAPQNRVANVVVAAKQPKVTSSEARAMGITTVLSSYSTAYSGTADRITNLNLAVQLIDGTLVPPGGTFSLNQEVGPRTLERGFRPAPVIIGGEYEEDVGGGVSQVATTVFNAAWEAGVKIVERAPHSLYISRYQLGRDATVNYPDLDMKFLNDTERWIAVFAGSGSTGIYVTLAGAPTGRRVVSEIATPLTVTGEVPIKRVPDPTLLRGTQVIEEEGSTPTTVTVTRKVLRSDGSVLYDETWRTNYRGEKRVIRVGTKKPPKAEPTTPPKGQQPPSTSTPTTTTPAPPPPPPSP
jgi:vancomycin resistance protein YoaR